MIKKMCFVLAIKPFSLSSLKDTSPTQSCFGFVVLIILAGYSPGLQMGEVWPPLQSPLVCAPSLSFTGVLLLGVAASGPSVRS